MLKNLWQRLAFQKYETVATLTVIRNYVGFETNKDYATFLLQENTEGRRKVKKQEKSSVFFSGINSTGFREAAIPWREGTKDINDLYGWITSADPHVFSRLGYNLVGHAGAPTQYEQNMHLINYYFYQNNEGKRRYTRMGSINYPYTLSNRHMDNQAQLWKAGQIELEDIPDFSPPSPKQRKATKKIEGNLLHGNFTPDQ